MNELDRREDPTIDEELAGCAMVDSCSNILSGDQFYNFLTHNFYRHFDQNRAPLGLFFHAAWLKNNPEYLDAFLYWVDEVLEQHPEVYFVTMTQVIQWIQNPVSIDSAKNFAPWQEKCSPGPRVHCLVPNSCKLSTDELPGEALRMHTCAARRISMTICALINPQVMEYRAHHLHASCTDILLFTALASTPKYPYTSTTKGEKCLLC